MKTIVDKEEDMRLWKEVIKKLKTKILNLLIRILGEFMANKKFCDVCKKAEIESSLSLPFTKVIEPATVADATKGIVATPAKTVVKHKSFDICLKCLASKIANSPELGEKLIELLK